MVTNTNEHSVSEKVPGKQVRWVPLTGVPMERRLQMLAVVTWVTLLAVCLSAFAFCIVVPLMWPMLMVYGLFVYFDQAPEKGGRRAQWTRRLTIWKYFADYFPVEFIKEHELDAAKNYVFGYHPHGIISMGAFANFATEATGFSDKYPGIVPSLLTLASNFRLPFYRDIIMALGIASVSRSSCEYILSSGPGRAVVIVVGGAAEALSARPGVADLTLKKRTGFIRIAIKHQASLVPVFSFGENELFEQVDNERGTLIYKMQKTLQKLAGFTLPLFHARGVFNYDVGLIPFRHPIVTVVGKPISVPSLEDGCHEPTEEQIFAVQTEYIKELKAIYDRYKDKYAKDRKRDLRMID